MPDTLLDRFSPDQLRDRVGPLTIARGAMQRQIPRPTDADPEARAWERGAEVRAGDGENGGADNEWIVSGHAAVFDVLSEELGLFYRFRERIQRGAFRGVLDDNQDVVDLFDHEGLPLARTSSNTLELREDPRGLFKYARWARTSYSDPIAEALRRGDLYQQSFAFTVAEDEWIERNVDGQDEPEVIRTVIKVERLYDTSTVTVPAYPQTDASLRTREIAAVGQRFGIAIPDERLQDGAGRSAQLFTGDGLPDGSSGSDEPGAADTDPKDAARGASRDDVAARAKRRLAIAKARTTT